MTFTSPPYEDARSYGLTRRVRGSEWVDWIFPRFLECMRVTTGIVAFVVDGRTRKGRYSLTPERLSIQLADAGYYVPKPAIFQRYGVPGRSNWLRPLNETIVCAAKSWPLPYANFKSGPAPKYRRGGNFSNRTFNGGRVSGRPYPKVNKTWRTNVFSGKVGKGHMGSIACHENEAPFPEWLAKDWLEIFCPVGGTVFDPFCGSGTTLAVAKTLSMNAVGVDIRESQVELTNRRLHE